MPDYGEFTVFDTINWRNLELSGSDLCTSPMSTFIYNYQFNEVFTAAMPTLALTSPTSGGRSVGIDRWRTKAPEFTATDRFEKHSECESVATM
jgi:hypothetical protein